MDNEFFISPYLKQKGVTRMAIENDQIVLILNDHAIKSEINEKFIETIFDIRYHLEYLTDNIALKEAIAVAISKNYDKYTSAITQTQKNIPPINANVKRNEISKEVTLEEWQKCLKKLLSELRQVVDFEFPTLWDCLEFQLSIKNILNIRNCNLPFAGVILGAPSSMKTLGIELFRNVDNTFYSDNFSPKSFVSHSTAVKREELADVDLLPKIKNKLFLTPELSPVFAKKDEDLTELLGIWIRILDGKGYESDSGTQGHRGYSGEFMFTWVGAAVEISKRVHKLLSTLGPKLYFYRIPKIEKSEDELFEQMKGTQFNKKFALVQNKLQEYLDWFDKLPTISTKEEQVNSSEMETPRISPKIEWDESKDEEKAIRIIIKLAKLLSPLRGIVTTWETRETQGTEYDYSVPIIEVPDRAITQLTNLARGHALIYGRNYITIEDIPLIVKVVLSTASIERVIVLDLLLNAGGKLTTSQITDALNISNSTAKRTMTEFKSLGIVDMKDGEYTNSEKSVLLKNKFSWFLEDEFIALRNNFTPYTGKNDRKNAMQVSMLQEKIPLSYIQSDGVHNKTDQDELFECYYCNDFIPNHDKKEYEKHIVNKHQGKPAYPSEVDLEKYSITPKGKIWEI